MNERKSTPLRTYQRCLHRESEHTVAPRILLLFLFLLPVPVEAREVCMSSKIEVETMQAARLAYQPPSAGSLG
jgi:hypothetical protein